MSEQPDKRRGFFGRLFGGRETPPAPTPAPVPEEAQVTPVAPPARTEDMARRSEHAAPPDVAEPGLPPAEISRPEPAVQELAPSEPPKQSWLKRLKSGLAKTSTRLSDGITSLFTKRRLDAATLDDLEDLLIQADLGVETAMRITEAIGKGRFEKGISADEVKAILSAEVERVLKPIAKPLVIDRTRQPHVVLVVGVNGTGKTTTIGKLAARFRREGLSVMMAAGDTFRAAAIDQLKIWGERTGAPVIARSVGADASGLAFDALKAAKEQGSDVLLLDTAGRLQNKQVLMEELEKVIRVLRKLDPTAPHDCLLVLDATTGQNAISQVEVFREKAGVTGLVMTKLDGTARGGILVAIAAKHQIPVHAIGVGEGVDDLQPFDPGEFARAIAAS
ncbi:MAG: signal recognition particle-docking protein FtsY [Hyphomicrobiaceae bacterium]|nr:signal recognition particle-docking protein FtsY [Hyphomicrobiaceae bacterium]